MGKSKNAFRTISEVADWLDTQAHVLRFWESKFSQVKPVKRAGGRRYYRPADMLLLGGIKKLLHDDGMTIKGAQKLLREKGTKFVTDLSQPLDDEEATEIAAVATEVIVEEQPPAEAATILSFDGSAENTPPAPAVDATEDENLDDMVGDLFAANSTPAQETSNSESLADQPHVEESVASTDTFGIANKVELEDDDEDRSFEEAAVESLVAETVAESHADPEEMVAEPATPETELPVEEAPAEEPESIADTEVVAPEAIAVTTPSPASEVRDPLLPLLARVRSISPETRADVGDLLEQLIAWKSRVAEKQDA